MIAFMKTVDGKTASLTHASYVKRRPVAEFDRLREENLKILDSIRRTITERSEPYRPKSLDNHHRYVFGLPWTLRRFNL